MSHLPATVPIPTPIYHITHLQNLDSILRAGGLRTCAQLLEEGVAYANIAHQNIQDRRRWTPVPCGPGGVLHDYVPCYFGPRSPMLYVISRGGVEGYAGGQAPVVHLVSTAQAIQAARLGFVFTDGHGIMAVTEFFHDLADLDKVDWKVMKMKYWNDTPEDGDRSRRRQAEFLVHQFFPWTLVQAIGVMTPAIAAQVTHALRGQAHQPAVIVRRGWYY
ncbi:MAG TPA: DUF4433 domain-containing protein [Methylomirabilota bacterium]|nr:DUF4433 domain-containing protein [Methylomirabilota bacterium]